MSTSADHSAALLASLRAGAPLLSHRLQAGTDGNELQQRSFLLGMTVDALRIGEGVLAETSAGRNQNGLRLARHLFEASMTALYVLRFGERAWRLLLADDAWRRLGIAETDWSGHFSVLEEELSAHQGLQRAAEADHLGSPLGTWIEVQMTGWAEGRLSEARISRLEALPGWSWASSADDEARAWYRDLHGGWMALLGYGELPGAPEAPWSNPHASGLSATQRAQLAVLLSRAGMGDLPVVDAHETIDDALASAPEFEGRLADRRRREQAADRRRELVGVRTERLDRGAFPNLAEVCQALERLEDHPVLYAPTSWLAHPRIQAAESNLEESADAIIAADSQGPGLDASACSLAVYALIPMLAEVSTKLSLADQVHPLLRAIGWPGPDSGSSSRPACIDQAGTQRHEPSRAGRT